MSKAVSRDSGVDVPEILQGNSAMCKVLRESIWRPARRKNDWRVFVVIGREGTGKSLTCASILKAVDPTFSAERTHFEVVPFLEDIRRDMDRPGRASMLDEAGVGFGKRTWQDREQVRANQALQTARDDNRVIGFTLPRLSELDSQLEGRIHLVFKTVKMKRGEWVEIKPFVVDPTRMGQGKEYTKHPKVMINGRMQKVRSFRIGPPPQSYITEYEPKKSAWKGELFDGLTEESSEEDADDMSAQDIATELAQDIGGVVSQDGKTGRAYINRDLIRAEYDCTTSDARTAKALLEKQFDSEALRQYV